MVDVPFGLSNCIYVYREDIAPNTQRNNLCGASLYTQEANDVIWLFGAQNVLMAWTPSQQAAIRPSQPHQPHTENKLGRQPIDDDHDETHMFWVFSSVLFLTCVFLLLLLAQLHLPPFPSKYKLMALEWIVYSYWSVGVEVFVVVVDYFPYNIEFRVIHTWQAPHYPLDTKAHTKLLFRHVLLMYVCVFV